MDAPRGLDQQAEMIQRMARRRLAKVELARRRAGRGAAALERTVAAHPSLGGATGFGSGRYLTGKPCAGAGSQHQQRATPAPRPAAVAASGAAPGSDAAANILLVNSTSLRRQHYPAKAYPRPNNCGHQ